MTVIKQLVFVAISLSLVSVDGYVILHPYISKVPPIYRIVQISGPLQPAHLTIENVTGDDASASNGNEGGLPAASTPQFQIMPGMVLPYGYAATGVVPFTGYVPPDAHYVNVYGPPVFHHPVFAVQQEKTEKKSDEKDVKKEEENKGDEMVTTEEKDKTQTKHKRDDGMGPIVKFTFPELRIKAPTERPSNQ